MSKKRVGGQVGNIFSRPSTAMPEKKEVEVESARPKTAVRGRPKVHDATAFKTMLTLREDQTLWLDRLALDVRSNTKAIIDRGTVIRALIDHLIESGIDLSNVTGEESIKETLSKQG